MERNLAAAMEQLEQDGDYSDDDHQLNDDEGMEDQEAVLPANEAQQIIIAFVDSQKGKQKAEYMGYLFIKEKLSKPNGDKQYWQCDKYKTADGGCKARLHTLVANNSFIKIMGQHTHEVDPAAVHVAQIKSNVRSMAAQSQDKPIQIFTNVLQNVPMLVSEQLKKSAIRKQVRRTRIKNQVPVVAANVVQDVVIPAEFKFYQGAELFLLADSGEHVVDPDRVLIFGRASNLEWAAEMKDAYFDGTFSVTPEPFTQVYAVMVEKKASNPDGGKYVFPILFSLLKNKNRATYDKLFGMIRSLMPNFEPNNVNVDFEQAVIHSLREIFPDASINGCFYHLMKNFKKQVGEAGLMKQYRDPETNFALISRMLMSLAFVPPQEVYECFRQLEVYLMREEPLLEPVITWFSRNYVGTVMRPAPFPIYLWSCYDRTLAGEDRTNNFAEAAHRRLQTIMGIDHPSIGRFLGELKQAQKLQDHSYEQCLAGHPAPKKRKKYEVADQNILARVQMYGETNLMEYLRGLAYNFVMDQ